MVSIKEKRHSSYVSRKLTIIKLKEAILLHCPSLHRYKPKTSALHTSFTACKGSYKDFPWLCIFLVGTLQWVLLLLQGSTQVTTTAQGSQSPKQTYICTHSHNVPTFLAIASKKRGWALQWVPLLLKGSTQETTTAGSQIQKQTYHHLCLVHSQPILSHKKFGWMTGVSTS